MRFGFQHTRLLVEVVLEQVTDERLEFVVGVFSTQDEVQGLQNRSWNEISPRTESKNEPFPAEPNMEIR